MSDPNVEPLPDQLRDPKPGELILTVRARHAGGFEVDLAHVAFLPDDWSAERLESFARQLIARAAGLREEG